MTRAHQHVRTDLAILLSLRVAFLPRSLLQLFLVFRGASATPTLQHQPQQLEADGHSHKQQQLTGVRINKLLSNFYTDRKQ